MVPGTNPPQILRGVKFWESKVVFKLLTEQVLAPLSPALFNGQL